MLYDIEVTAAQLQAAAGWALQGPGMAPVKLCHDDSPDLSVAQGDARAAFHPSGARVLHARNGDQVARRYDCEGRP